MIHLRNYQAGDEKRVMGLLKKTLDEYSLDIDPEKTDKDIVDIESSYMKNRGAFKILDENGKIIGSFGLARIDDQTCELRKMYLYSQYRGRGLGRLMMEDALSTARKLEYKTIVLETNRVLKGAAAMYKKFGFAEYEPDHFSCRRDLAMKKNLSENSD